MENGEVAYPAPTIASPIRRASCLVAAMNPCRCGHAYEPAIPASAPHDRCTADYQARIRDLDGDRIDLRIDGPAVTATDLILPPPSEGSRRWPRAWRPRATFNWRACRRRTVRHPHQCRSAGVGAEGRRAARRERPQTVCATPPKTMRLSARGLSSACCASPGPSPISTARNKIAGCIWPKRCPTGAGRRSPARRRSAVFPYVTPVRQTGVTSLLYTLPTISPALRVC